MIGWLIGVILCSIITYIYVGTRESDTGKPVLTLGWLMVIIVLGIIPFINILISIILTFIWVIIICEKDWAYIKKPGKVIGSILKFLKKPIG